MVRACFLPTSARLFILKAPLFGLQLRRIELFAAFWKGPSNFNFLQGTLCTLCMWSHDFHSPPEKRKPTPNSGPNVTDMFANHNSFQELKKVKVEVDGRIILKDDWKYFFFE